MNKEQIEKRFNRVADQRANFYFIELNEGIASDGLPYKFLYVFDVEGKNISQEMADLFEYKTTKRAKFYGSLMTSGYGFKFTDYVFEKMKKNNLVKI